MQKIILDSDWWLRLIGLTISTNGKTKQKQAVECAFFANPWKHNDQTAEAEQEEED